MYGLMKGAIKLDTGKSENRIQMFLELDPYCR